MVVYLHNKERHSISFAMRACMSSNITLFFVIFATVRVGTRSSRVN
jgi:hypothetical protein